MTHNGNHDTTKATAMPLELVGAVLPGYQVQVNESGLDHSLQKLQDAAKDFTSFYANPTIQPPLSEEETLNYRCTCTFQLVELNGCLEYAMRHKQMPVLLNSRSFPIASRRIQGAMKNLSESFASNHAAITNNLTSVSFASSWNDEADSDLIVTLHYNKEILDRNLWRSSALDIQNRLHNAKLIGRSKGVCLAVHETQLFLNDTVYIWEEQKSHDSATTYKVSLQRPEEGRMSIIPVKYQKPQTAFFHPNAGTMTKALEWMIRRIGGSSNKSLLEMYCGCGAHTVALAKMGFLKRIAAVELDQRLVDACIVNCKLNSCHDQDSLASSSGVTPVSVFKGDASEWARKALRQSSKEDAEGALWFCHSYDWLLMDPPRSGLDEQICRMAIETASLQDMIYISCGRQALKRDLHRLSSDFEVVDLELLDLFPRTDAVESLVHLRRRKVKE